MSDYFLNKIYNSLLSNKPLLKKPEPIVEKKQTFKPLSKVYEILIREAQEHVAVYGSQQDVDPNNIPEQPGLDTLGVVSKDVVDHIKKEIRDSSYQKDIIQFLASKNYTKDSFNGRGFYLLLQAIFDTNDEDIKKLFEFVNTKNDLKITQHLTGNIASLAKNKGFSDTIINNISRLNELQDPRGSSVGPGEVLFAILFSDVQNSITGGDLVTGNKKIEIKKNEGRFGPQRSTYIMPKEEFIAPFIKDQNIIDKFISTTSIQINDILKKSYDMVPAEYKEQFINLTNKKLDNFYGKGKTLAYKYFTKDIYESNNSNNLRKALLKLYSDGYLKDDEYIMFIDEKFNYVITTKEQFFVMIDKDEIKSDTFRIRQLYPNVSYKIKKT